MYHIDTVLMDAVEAFRTQLAKQGTCATPITDDQIFWLMFSLKARMIYTNTDTNSCTNTDTNIQLAKQGMCVTPITDWSRESLAHFWA